MECVRCGALKDLKKWNASIKLCPKDMTWALEINGGNTPTCECLTLRPVCDKFKKIRWKQDCSNCYHDVREHEEYKKGKLKWTPKPRPMNRSQINLKQRR